MKFPDSAFNEVKGMVYFPRLCSKVRYFQAGELHEDFHANLGKAMDLWTCQFLGVDYDALAAVIKNGASDEEALEWAHANGSNPNELELSWWNSYMRNRGFRDDLGAKLQFRIEEGNYQDKGIQTFFDYFEFDEGRV